MSYFVIGNPVVIEQDGEIAVKNVYTKTMVNDIKKIFKTARVGNNLFKDISRASFTIDSFFALELYQILEKAIAHPRYGLNVRVLSKIQQGLKENTWLGNIDKDVEGVLDFKALRDFHFKPLDFQRTFMETYSRVLPQYHLTGMLLAAAAGSGKTYTSLATLQCANVERIIVVCPKNAVYKVWRDSINSLYKRTPSHWIYADGKRYSKERISVVHYEGLKALLDNSNAYPKGKTGIILDESHNLNELTSARTQQFITLCERLDARHVIWASGTPIKAVSAESIPLLATIDKNFTKGVQGRFKRIYAGNTSVATEILAHRLGVVSYKVEKSQLGLNKPIFENISVRIPNGEAFTLEAVGTKMRTFSTAQIAYYKDNFAVYKKTYDEGIAEAWATLTGNGTNAKLVAKYSPIFNRYHKDVAAVIRAHDSGNLRSVGEEIVRTNSFEREYILPNLTEGGMRKRFKEAKSVVKYMKLKVQGECLGRVVGGERIRAHVAMVPHIDYNAIFDSTQKKSIVFTSYVEAVEACVSHLSKAGAKPLHVYGKNSTQLASTVTRFDKDKNANPLVTTYATLSTAVPLVMADTMLLLNAPFRDYVLQQAVSRIHRLGSDTQTRVFTAVLDTGDTPNISSRNFDILKWSQAQIEAIINIESPFKLEEDEDLSAPMVEVGLIDSPAPISTLTKWLA